MPIDATLKPSWPAGSSVEQRFVLALIGYQTPQREKEWRELLPRVNWAVLLEVTGPDLYPYLHFCLQTRASAESCPRQFMRQLAGVRQVTALRNLRLIAEFRDIQTALAQQNIPVIVLKGIALVFLAYSDPSLRPMNDMDLFIQAKHLDSAVRILRSLGYRCPNRSRGHHFEGELKLEKPGTRVLIELHTQIEISAPASTVDATEIWGRSVQNALPGLVMGTLNEQDFLLHLSLHMARRHCFTHGLLPLVDILRWVEIHGAHWDWPTFLRNAQAKNDGAYVELTLDLARDFLGAPIPLVSPPRLPDLGAAKQMAWQQMSQDRRLNRSSPEWLAELLSSGSLNHRVLGLLNRFRRKRGTTLRSVEGVYLDILSAIRCLLKSFRSGSLSRTHVQRQIHMLREREKLAALLRGYGSRPG